MFAPAGCELVEAQGESAVNECIRWTELRKALVPIHDDGGGGNDRSDLTYRLPSCRAQHRCHLLATISYRCVTQ